MNSPVASPKQERSLETRARILDEALHQFAEKGFDAASVRDIASAAEVTHGLVKYYFGSKETLWREAVAYLFDRMSTELAASNAEGVSPKEQFADFIRRYVAYCARHPEHARLMVQESMHDNARLSWAAQSFITVRHQRLLPTIEALIEQGALPRMDPRLLIYALNSVAQAPFMLAPEIAHTHGVDVQSDAVIADYAESVVTLFLR